jgi:predicted N-acetyltransferase YhbS
MNSSCPTGSGISRFGRQSGRDASQVAGLVEAAYGHYVGANRDAARPDDGRSRRGYPHHDAIVAESDGIIIGIIVLAITDEGFLIYNVAVHPSHGGMGLGRALLEFAGAQAQRAGFDSIYL